MDMSPDEMAMLYADPSNGTFAEQKMMPLDAFFQQHPHQQQMQEQAYSPASAAFTMDDSANTVFPDSPASWDMFGQSTPLVLDQDLSNPGLASSLASTASGPSAPSSAVGSPSIQHTHQEWQQPQQQPIVRVINSASPNLSSGPNDFYGHSNYSFGSQLEDISQYEFMQPKTLNDPSSLHPEVRQLGLSIPQPPSPHNAFFSFQPPQAEQPHIQQQVQHMHMMQQQQQMMYQPPQANPMSYAFSPGPSPSMPGGLSPSKIGESPSIKSDAISPFTTSPFAPNFTTTPTPMSVGSINSARHMPRGSISGASSIDLTRSASRDDRAVSRGSISAHSTSGADTSALSDDGNGDGKEKQLCPNPDCGRRFKDLRAHMLTHQNERPEKCPIQTCEYHTRGFARKYDKNRHTLTHYKGTMVCGFCPGSGSSAEKSFNRADVFKRHLTSVHGVEQTPPNSRRKQQPVPDADLSGLGGSGLTASGGVSTSTHLSGDVTGKCSTCSQKFANAQDFYEHLDDCVLRIVQQEDPAEAVNESRLAEVEDDQEVKATLEKNQVLHSGTPLPGNAVYDDEDDDMEDDLQDPKKSPATLEAGSSGFGSPNRRTSGALAGKATLGGGVQKSRGMTHSRGGVPFTGKVRSRRSRHNYPASWGFDKGQMTLRKRVMTVFEGPRRLAKDDMMLSLEHEVRVPLSDGKSYVTDLDLQTIKRAEGFLNATEEEKGPWISDDPTEEEKMAMQLQQQQQLAQLFGSQQQQQLPQPPQPPQEPQQEQKPQQ